MKTVLIVSDQHCGSHKGLLPEAYWNDFTSEKTKWLWQSWLEFIDWLPSEIDLIALNGDLVDGAQRRSDGVGLVTTSLGGQVSMAIECMEPLLRKAKRVIRTEGTAYHETFHGPLAALDEHFDITMPPDVQQRIVRDIDLGGGAILNIKHQPEGEGALYRGTTLDREVLWATITETLHRIPKATHIVRSHLHSFNGFKGFGKHIHLCPCWCLQQAYATNKKYYRWTPEIGGLLMEASPRAHAGWETLEKVYPLPAVEAEPLDAIPTRAEQAAEHFGRLTNAQP